MSTVKILNIFGCMTAGGAEKRTLDIMRNLDNHEFIMDYCALSGRKGELEAEIEKLGGRTHHCKLGFGFSRRFIKLLKDEQYDVVHSHVHMFSGYILWLASKANVKCRIAHFRSMNDGNSNSIRRSIQRKIMRGLVDKYATDIIAVSEGTMDSAWSKNWREDKRCKVIYNGIDLKEFQIERQSEEIKKEFNIPHDGTIFIHVGNMTVPKNHKRLISIFNEVLTTQTNSYLLIVGRYEEEIFNQLKTLIGQYGIEDKVKFCGTRNDVPRLLRGSDIMVFPSLWEGLPGAVLEACASGIPVVASDLPCIEEIKKYFPRLNTISLKSNDEIWKTTIINELNIENGMSEFNFNQTPFYIKDVVEIVKNVWKQLG